METEEVGFEPTVRLWRTHAFQACSLSHSDTPPGMYTLTYQQIIHQDEIEHLDQKLFLRFFCIRGISCFISLATEVC